MTFAEVLDGSPARRVDPHPLPSLERVHPIFTGSWIDERGSAPGVDLGTWIGEAEENRAWDLLGEVRDLFTRSRATPQTAPLAFEALHAAEGSDWFWWLGADQDSRVDDAFDDLFRMHLRAACRALGVAPPPELERHIVLRPVVWSPTAPARSIQRGELLLVRTTCPGILTWRLDATTPRAAGLLPITGLASGVRLHQVLLGPFEACGELQLSFRCTHGGCHCGAPCCDPTEQVVRIV